MEASLMQELPNEMGVRRDRRKNPDGRQYQIKELWAIHHEILRRLLLGQNNREIAADLGIDQVVVSYTKNSALGKRHLELLKGAVDAETVDVKVLIKDMAVKAAEVLKTAMEGTHPMALKLVAAKEVLDRAGYPKVIRTENLHAHLTDEDIKSIKSRAREEGMIVEAEIEEVPND